MKPLLLLILLLINLSLFGQSRTIQGRVITEYLEELPFVEIFNKDTILIGKTDFNGKFILEIPQNTERILLGYVGMEWTPVILKNGCDTLEIIMMYSGNYDFMTLRKVDRLRFRRFKKLPQIHKGANEKGIFHTKYPCHKQEFVPIKPRFKK